MARLGTHGRKYANHPEADPESGDDEWEIDTNLE